MKFKLDNEIIASFLVPTVTFIVIVAMVPLIILPQLQKIKEQSNSLKTKDQNLTRLKAKLDVLNSINKDDLEAKITDAEFALPSGKGLAPLIDGLKKIANKSDMNLTSIKLKPGKVASKSASLGDSIQSLDTTANSKYSLLLNIDASGKIEDFEKFLSYLEKAKRLVIVQTFSLTLSPSGTTYSLILNAPYKPIVSSTSEDIALKDLPVETQQTDKVLTILKNFDDYSFDVTPCALCTGNVKNPFP